MTDVSQAGSLSTTRRIGLDRLMTNDRGLDLERLLTDEVIADLTAQAKPPAPLEGTPVVDFEDEEIRASIQPEGGE